MVNTAGKISTIVDQRVGIDFDEVNTAGKISTIVDRNALFRTMYGQYGWENFYYCRWLILRFLFSVNTAGKISTIVD